MFQHPIVPSFFDKPNFSDPELKYISVDGDGTVQFSSSSADGSSTPPTAEPDSDTRVSKGGQLQQPPVLICIHGQGVSKHLGKTITGPSGGEYYPDIAVGLLMSGVVRESTTEEDNWAEGVWNEHRYSLSYQAMKNDVLTNYIPNVKFVSDKNIGKKQNGFAVEILSDYDEVNREGSETLKLEPDATGYPGKDRNRIQVLGYRIEKDIADVATEFSLTSTEQKTAKTVCVAHHVLHEMGHHIPPFQRSNSAGDAAFDHCYDIDVNYLLWPRRKIASESCIMAPRWKVLIDPYFRYGRMTFCCPFHGEAFNRYLNSIPAE